MRFVVFGILDMRWKYRKMVKPQERLFMQSKRLHKESFFGSVNSFSHFGLQAMG